jgi:hypothetical protein
MDSIGSGTAGGLTSGICACVLLARNRAVRQQPHQINVPFIADEFVTQAPGRGNPGLLPENLADTQYGLLPQAQTVVTVALNGFAADHRIRRAFN